MKKKILSIGIDEYTAGVRELKGCVNDAINWHKFFINIGFDAFESTPILNEQADKEELLQKVKSFIESLEDNDIGVITYSGHGTLFKKKYIFFDEAIYARNGKILASELEDYLSLLKDKAKLIFIIDACHSQGIIDINYILKPVEKMLKKNSFRKSKNCINKTNTLSCQERFYFSGIRMLKKSFFKALVGNNRKKVFLITACKSYQTAKETTFEDVNEVRGVFSYYALKLLNSSVSTNLTYNSFIEKIRADVPVEFKQTAKARFSKDFGDEILFS